VPLASPDDEDGFRVVFARGAESEGSGLPAAIAATDEGESQSTGARLAVIGLAVTWLPPEISDRFIRNLADWALTE
jgi:hypothetical protein